MQAYDTTVQDVFGNAIPGGITQTGASVTVYVGGTSILASIFADQAGAQPLPNPFTSGPNGQITFFAANGNYDVTVSYSGFTITKHIILFDPSGSLINNATPTVPLLSDLRAISTSTAAAAKAVITTGRNSPGDGGGGTFVYVPTDTTSADNGVTIIVDAAGRRWYRQVDAGGVTAEQAGAVGDGITDDTGAINTLISACSGKYAMVLNKTYKITGTGIRLQSGSVLYTPGNTGTLSFSGSMASSNLISASGASSIFLDG